MFQFHDNLQGKNGRSINTYTYHANLNGEGGVVEGDVSFASVSSLYFKATNGKEPENGENFGSIELQLNNNLVTLEDCRFIKNSSISEFDGQIIFTNDVYNIYELFTDEKLVNVKCYFSDLPGVLSRKEKIDPVFRDFTSNLVYDLNTYKSFFDKIDHDYAYEDPEIFSNIESIVFKKEGKKFYEYLDNKLVELQQITSPFTPSEHQKHGEYFRRQLWGIILQAGILARTNLKPRGYQGDSGTLNMIYENKYLGDSIFSKLLHKHPIGSPAAVAVRNRKTFISSQIKKVHGEKKGKRNDPLHILSMACGPARELEDIFTDPEDFDKFSFCFFDQDHKAILDARHTINLIETSMNKKMKYEFYPESVRSLLKNQEPEFTFGTFDFIYSMGLYDYLTDRIAKKLTEHMYRMLKPGGRMAIGNYHVDNPSRIYMEYWLDWVLCYRTEAAFLALTEDLENSSVEIEFEPTRSQMFAVIRREK